MSQIQVTGEAKIRDIQGPVVANSGVITALDGAASQYVRGDGTLADFPTSSGGGSSVSYYLNSSVSQGTIGGVAYRELSKEPIIGTGTDIAISSNGYVASYITDANDPDVTIVPGGNFNCEFYFSVNNNTGNPTTYAELYKYDGTTFTLLGTSAGVPESINQGTTIAPYYFAIPVATAALSVTDRLAIRIYVSVDGRTVTLHTENSHLCQVVTTLSKGMVSLNNLTDQSQYLATGTAGTNFAIVSTGDTHTFNLPVASATNTGKLSSTDWSTFNGKVPYTGATNSVDLGAYSLSADTISGVGIFSVGSGTIGGYIGLKQGDATIINVVGYNQIYANNTKYVLISNAGSTNYKSASFDLASLTNNTARTFTLPDASGTLALTSDLGAYVTLATTQTISGAKTFSATNLKLEPTFGTGAIIDLYQGTFSGPTNGFTSITSSGLNLRIIASTGLSTSKNAILDLSLLGSTERTYSFPDATGTLALTSNLSAYLPLTGGTLTGALSGTSATFSSNITVNSVQVGSAGNTTNIKLGENTFSSLTSGSNNIAIGSNALSSMTTSNANIGIGNSALASVINGTFNTGIGFAIGASITSGSYNALFGYGAGSSITTGNYNTILGGFAGTANMSNNIVLADGQGNVRYQWDGTNNVFGNPISGTSASFSSSVTASSFVKSGGTSSQFLKADGSTTTLTNIVTGTGTEGNIPVFTASGTIGNSTISEFEGGVNINNYLYSGLPYFSYDTSLAASFRITSNTNGNQVRLAFGTVSGIQNYSNIVTTIVDNSSNTKGRLDFQVRSGNNSFATPLTLEHTGNVGIGTSSPSYPLTVGQAGSTADSYIQIASTTTGTGNLFFGDATGGGVASYSGYIQYQHSADAMVFGTTNTERMRITSSGSVGIGTSSPSQRLTLVGSTSLTTFAAGTDTAHQILIGADASYAEIQAIHQAVTFNKNLILQRQGGDVAIGTSTPLLTASGRGNLTINGSSSSILSFGIAGAYSGYVYSGPSNFEIDAQGSRYMQFNTNGQERARITSGGFTKMSSTGNYLNTAAYHEMRVNTTDNWITYFSNITTSSPYGIIVDYRLSSPNSTVNQFLYCVDSVGVRMEVRSNGGISNYQANDTNLSDERTKKDISPLESYWDKFKAIEIVKFKYKDQTHDDFNIGVIAQQVEKVAPEFVDVDGWGKPKLDEEGNEIASNEEPLKSVYTSDLHHATIKVLQEAMAKIEEQQAQIEELKALIAAK